MIPTFPSKPLLTPSCEALLRRYVAGDTAALDQLYRDYVVEVEGIVRRFVRVRRPGSSSLGSDDVCDLVQEIFLRAFCKSARRTFDPRRPYGPFLGALARNVLIDRSRRRGEVPTLDIGKLAEASVPPANDASIDDETAELITRHLKDLPSDLRSVYEHRYVLGWSQQQTCLALGRTRQQLRTLETRLHRELGRRLGHPPDDAGASRRRSPRFDQPSRASST